MYLNWLFLINSFIVGSQKCTVIIYDHCQPQTIEHVYKEASVCHQFVNSVNTKNRKRIFDMFYEVDVEVGNISCIDLILK